MSWWFIVALAAGCYAFKVIGLVVVGDRQMPPVVVRCLALIPAAMISALVVAEHVLRRPRPGDRRPRRRRRRGGRRRLRRAPLIVVILLGAAVTAAGAGDRPLNRQWIRVSRIRVGLWIWLPGNVPSRSTTRSVGWYERTQTLPLASVGTTTRLEAIGLAVLFSDEVPWKPAAQAKTAVHPVPGDVVVGRHLQHGDGVGRTDVHHVVRLRVGPAGRTGVEDPASGWRWPSRAACR